MHSHLQGSLPSLPITQWRGEGECVVGGCTSFRVYSCQWDHLLWLSEDGARLGEKRKRPFLEIKSKSSICECSLWFSQNPEPQPTTPVRTSHSSVEGPFCWSCASPCKGNTTAQPTWSVLTERLPLRITVAPHCISRGRDVCAIRDSGASTKHYKSNAALAGLLTVEICWTVQEFQTMRDREAEWLWQGLNYSCFVSSWGFGTAGARNQCACVCVCKEQIGWGKRRSRWN